MNDSGSKPDSILLPELVEEHSPISRVIHRALREAILSGVFPPGQVLRQEELARRFRASRAPLREALNMLEAEGLVVLRPRRGFAVTSLNPLEMLEILQLRMVIEEHAAYVATQARRDDDVARLRRCLAEMDDLPTLAPSEKELARWSALNLEFHDCLDAVSGRHYLCQIASNLRAKLEPYIRLEVHMTKGLEEAQRDHHEIVGAFAAGDAERVARLIRAHSEHTARRLFAALHLRGLALDVDTSTIAETGSRATKLAVRAAG